MERQDEDLIQMLLPANEALRQIVAKHGRLHGLFNNAGGQFPATPTQISDSG